MTTLIAFSGSLRADSFNTRILKALPALAPEGTNIALFDIAELPMYNQDLDADTVPPIVEALRAAIAEADQIVQSRRARFATADALFNDIEEASRK